MVRDVLEDSFIIEVADGVKMRILKASISARRDASAPKNISSKGKKDSVEANPAVEAENEAAHAEGKARVRFRVLSLNFIAN